MIVDQLYTGGDRNFAYIVADPDSKLAAVVDPSYAPGQVFRRVEELGLTVRYVLNTHNHHDHTNGNEEMEQLTGRAALQFGKTDPETGLSIEDGVKLPLGSLEIQVIHTPGHTHDSVCYLVEDALFTGDTLFVGKVGGTDFGRQAKTQFETFRDKLLPLDDHLRVFPGHDVGERPQSTIGEERMNNPFLVRTDYADFLHLKKTWLQYKQEHGIA